MRYICIWSLKCLQKDIPFISVQYNVSLILRMYIYFTNVNTYSRNHILKQGVYKVVNKQHFWSMLYKFAYIFVNLIFWKIRYLKYYSLLLFYVVGKEIFMVHYIHVLVFWKMACHLNSSPLFSIAVKVTRRFLGKFIPAFKYRNLGLFA